MTFLVGVFFLEGFFAAAFVAFTVFFLLDGRFFATAFFEAGVFLAAAFFLPALARCGFLLLGFLTVFFEEPRFLLLVFFVDVLSLDEAPPDFFAEGFLLDFFMAVVFVPLLLLLAANFLLGISFRSKTDSESRRLYIRNCLAEAFSFARPRSASRSQLVGPFQSGLRRSTTTVV